MCTFTLSEVVLRHMLVGGKYPNIDPIDGKESKESSKEKSSKENKESSKEYIGLSRLTSRSVDQDGWMKQLFQELCKRSKMAGRKGEKRRRKKKKKKEEEEEKKRKEKEREEKKRKEKEKREEEEEEEEKKKEEKKKKEKKKEEEEKEEKKKEEEEEKKEEEKKEEEKKEEEKKEEAKKEEAKKEEEKKEEERKKEEKKKEENSKPITNALPPNKKATMPQHQREQAAKEQKNSVTSLKEPDLSTCHGGAAPDANDASVDCNACPTQPVKTDVEENPADQEYSTWKATKNSEIAPFNQQINETREELDLVTDTRDALDTTQADKRKTYQLEEVQHMKDKVLPLLI